LRATERIFRYPRPCPFGTSRSGRRWIHERSLGGSCSDAKTLRGALSPNAAPWPEQFQVSTCFQLDAGRATRVAEKRPASHTLLSTSLFIPEDPLVGKQGIPEVTPDRWGSPPRRRSVAETVAAPAGAPSPSYHWTSSVMSFAGCLPTLVRECVYPPGSHFTSPDLNCPGMGPWPSTSLRSSRSLTATSRCGPAW
jgi:hypothetical protein